MVNNEAIVWIENRSSSQVCSGKKRKLEQEEIEKAKTQGQDSSLYLENILSLVTILIL